jgi:hypothetical protein
MFLLQREKPKRRQAPAAERERIDAKVKAWRDARLVDPTATIPDPLTAEEREAICAYEYALVRPVATEDDLVVRDGDWGTMGAAAASRGAYEDDDAFDGDVVARQMGCKCLPIAQVPPLPQPPVELTDEEQEVADTAARKARVAAYRSEQARLAEEAVKAEAVARETARVDAIRAALAAGDEPAALALMTEAELAAYEERKRVAAERQAAAAKAAADRIAAKARAPGSDPARDTQTITAADVGEVLVELVRSKP